MNIYEFDLKIKVTVPAKNKDQAEQKIRNWEEEVQNSIGGLSFLIEESEYLQEIGRCSDEK